MTTNPTLDDLLSGIETWGASNAAAAIVGPAGMLAAHGDPAYRFAWASVTKPITAMVVLMAARQGLLDLDEPWGPPGATVRHLLAHASGLPFEGAAVLATPGARRIYSNLAFDRVGELVTARTGKPFGTVLSEWLLEPLGMTGATLVDRPSQGLQGTLDDLIALAGELLRPARLPREVVESAATVAFPGLPGVTPGVGRFDDCAWGLGFEIHAAKSPHWMGARNSPATFGHFGGAGTFLWVDPVADVALAALTDRAFGSWALEAWPALSDGVLLAIDR